MTKFSAFGTEIAWDPAGGSSFTAIAQVASIDGPSITREEIDVTTHDSLEMWREFIKSLKDGGEVSFDLVFDPDLGTHNTTTGLLSDYSQDQTIATWRLTFPDTTNTTWTFPGFITEFGVTAAIDDALKASITIKVSGKPTLA